MRLGWSVNRNIFIVTKAQAGKDSRNKRVISWPVSFLEMQLTLINLNYKQLKKNKDKFQTLTEICTINRSPWPLLKVRLQSKDKENKQIVTCWLQTRFPRGSPSLPTRRQLPISWVDRRRKLNQGLGFSIPDFFSWNGDSITIIFIHSLPFTADTKHVGSTTTCVLLC